MSSNILQRTKPSCIVTVKRLLSCVMAVLLTLAICPLSIFADEGKQIQSIEVRPIELVEYTNGYYYDESDVFNSNYGYTVTPDDITVTLKDGTVISGTPSDIYDSLGVYPTFTDYQSRYTEWGVGEHIALISLAGYTTTYSVVIKESPIKSVEVEDINIPEGSSYDWTSTYYSVDMITCCRIKITFDDGHVLTSENGSVWCEDTDGTLYRLYTNDKALQKDTRWSVGNTYRVTGLIGGFRTEFNVSITDSVIESLTVEPVSVIEGTQQDDGTYRLFTPPYTVKLKDGRVEKGYNFYDDIWIDDFRYSFCVNAQELQEQDKWTLGNTYTVTATVGTASTSYPVTVIENPVESLTVDDVTFYENTDGWYETDAGGDAYYVYPIFYDDILQPWMSSHIQLKDGTKVEPRVRGSLGYGAAGVGFLIYNQFYEGPFFETDQETNHWGIGMHVASAEFLGVKTQFNVHILKGYISGDLDGDEEITDWDGVLLARYLAGWDVDISKADALDIDGDGEITDWDGVLLDRYLAGWDIKIGQELQRNGKG